MDNKEYVVFIGDDLPYRVALKDIAEYLTQHKMNKRDEHGDIWNVTAKQMANKQVRRMNIELGVHKVNKFGSRVGKRKK
jgi:hypothetical protein